MRVNQQPAYVLHARPWSETSLLVDVFTREHGRFRLLAKGARRQKTGQRAVLQPFQPILISWSARRSLGTLTGVEMCAHHPRLCAEHLASAYYMSELLFKFLHAHDAHESLFEAYDQAIGRLCEKQDVEPVLRCFECSLLSEVGYGLQLEHDAGNLSPVHANARYYYYPEKGPIEVRENDNQAGLTISGRTLQALSSKVFDNPQVQKESKQLLRMLLTRQVKGRVFNTRVVYAQMLKGASGNS
jgi:DNA repair protein RecO (recombination protein O)